MQQYVEDHLADRVSIERLAAVAGLSVFHFARAFKQSRGMTPHGYLLHRRIARAQKQVGETELPLSEIALVTGFADQSHLARHFRGARWRLSGDIPAVTAVISELLARTGPFAEAGYEAAAKPHDEQSRGVLVIASSSKSGRVRPARM